MSENRTIKNAKPFTHRWGVGLRRPHFDMFFNENNDVDIIELLAENFMDFGGRPRRVLEQALSRHDAVVHSVNMSLAGPDPLSESFLSNLKNFLDVVNPPWFSDHLTYSRAFGREYHDLIPFPYTPASLEHVAKRIGQVQDTMKRPFLIENSSYYVSFRESTITEADFISRLVSLTGCGLLLDVNNIYVNATNHGYDPVAFLDALPLDAVCQYHMAGHDASGLFLVDTHGAPAPPPVMALYEEALRRTGPVWTIFEWDNNIPPLDELLSENRKVRAAGEHVISRGDAPCPHPKMADTPTPYTVQNSHYEQLNQTWSTLHELFTAKTDVGSAATVLNVATERLAIYPRMVRHHVVNIIEKNFASVKATLSNGTWEKIVDDFYRTCPSTHFEMNETARAFPEFLVKESDYISEISQFHIELAQLEWAEFEVYKTSESQTTTGDTLASPVLPVLNDTLQIFEFEYPVVSFLSDSRRGKRPKIPSTSGPETALVFRHPQTLYAHVYPASDELVFAFKLIHDGIAYEDAATEADITVSQVEDIIAYARKVGILV